MKPFQKSLLIFLAPAVPLAIICTVIQREWSIDSVNVLPRSYYLFNDFLLLLLAFEAFTGAFLISRQNRESVLKKALLTTSSLLFIIAILDMTVLIFSCHTTGPGGKSSIAHTNWYRRSVHNNEMGYWEVSMKPFMDARSGGKTRIAVLGDSFTWGQGLTSSSQRFSNILGKRLGEEAEVLNFGRGGTDTRDQLQEDIPLIRKVHPDIVLLCYLSNDIHNGLHLFKPAVPHYSYFQRHLLRASPLYNYIYYRALFPAQWGALGTWSFVSIISNYRDPQTMEEHRQDMKKMVAAVKEMGARPIAVILPFPHLWEHIERPYRDAIYAAVADGYRMTGTPVIELEDLEETFPPGKFEVNPSDGHPNAAVHRTMADRIYGWLMAHPGEWKSL
jgi:lysophospholipase L1-like esterase